MTGLLEDVSFTRPIVVFLAVPALLYVVLIAAVARSGVVRWAVPLMVLLRGSLVIGLVILLAGPVTYVNVQVPGRVEFLFDVSRSIGAASRREAVGNARTLMGSLRDDHPDVQAVLTAFAGDHETIWQGRVGEPPGSEVWDRLLERGRIESVDEWKTLLLPALLRSAAGDAAGVDVLRRIYTDGALPPPPPGKVMLPGRTQFHISHDDADHNVRILSLVSPPDLEAGNPLQLALVYESGVPLSADAVLKMDGDIVREWPVNLKAGQGELAFNGQDVIPLPGDHRVVMEIRCADAEPMDNSMGIAIRVAPFQTVLHVAGVEKTGGRRAALLRALEVQDLRVVSKTPDEVLSMGGAWSGISAVILDQVSSEQVPDGMAQLLAGHVSEGGGLFLIPRDVPDELVRWSGHAIGEMLPMAGIPSLPAVQDPGEIEEQGDGGRKRLSAPNVDQSTIKKVNAPTLTLLLLIDKSASMRDFSKLSNAKKGAIATARELHPQDRIGVIAYNEDPVEIVPITEAARIGDIEASIQRLKADGQTDIRKALEFARDLLAHDEAAIKLVVLLSDGVAKPFYIKPVMESLVAGGISTTTIGIGPKFDASTLTQIAKFGRGTGPIPARTSSEIPKVMVAVASKFIEENNTRRSRDPVKTPTEAEMLRPHRPLPGGGKISPAGGTPGDAKDERIRIRVSRPVSFLDGLPWAALPSLYGMHASRRKPGSWISLSTESDSPVLAHWRVGDGIVAQCAAPIEGSWGRDIALWDHYPVFVAQLTRFIERIPGRVRLDLTGEIEGDRISLTCFDARSRGVDGADWSFQLFDGDGSGLPFTPERLAEGRYLLTLASPLPGGFVRARAVAPGGDAAREIWLPVPVPREVRRRGLDLDRVQDWQACLSADLVRGTEGDTWGMKRSAVYRPTSADLVGLVILLVLFGFDLVLKRLFRIGRP